FHRGNPQLAQCVREAIEEYLHRRHNGQTENCPLPIDDNNGQTEKTYDNRLPENGTPEREGKPIEDIRQTRNVPVSPVPPPGPHGDNISLPENILEEPVAAMGDNNGQTENSMPAYDTSKYMLGKLCPRRHEHGPTGQSLLRITNRHCILCDREKFHE